MLKKWPEKLLQWQSEAHAVQTMFSYKRIHVFGLSLSVYLQLDLIELSDWGELCGTVCDAAYSTVIALYYQLSCVHVVSLSCFYNLCCVLSVWTCCYMSFQLPPVLSFHCDVLFYFTGFISATLFPHFILNISNEIIFAAKQQNNELAYVSVSEIRVHCRMRLSSFALYFFSKEQSMGNK